MMTYIFFKKSCKQESDSVISRGSEFWPTKPGERHYLKDGGQCFFKHLAISTVVWVDWHNQREVAFFTSRNMVSSNHGHSS